jgi:hypothetical protein
MMMTAETITIKVERIGINEGCAIPRTLITVAHEFLIQYVEADQAGNRIPDQYHELAAAARGVIFSCSYVSTEAKHALMHDANEAIHRAMRDGLPEGTTYEEALRIKAARGDRLASVLADAS